MHLTFSLIVFTFAAVTIGVLNDKTDLSRLDDKTYRQIEATETGAGESRAPPAPRRHPLVAQSPAES